jgi:tetratricopeptide (TPR) repeat protein
MQTKAWMLVGAIALVPPFARAQSVLDKPHTILGDGVSLVVQGRYADAEKKLREALREQPSLREGHYNLAVALREQGQIDEAIEEYGRALAMYSPDDEPNRAKCLYGMALAKEARGDKDAWDAYLAFARPYADEQPDVQIAMDHRDVLNGVKVPGTYRKATR